MRISGKAFALGGAVIVASVALAPAHAGSFGQQWRPATYSPAPQQAYRHVANMPAFRPLGSLSSPRHMSRGQAPRRAVTAPSYAARPANRTQHSYRPTRPAPRTAYRSPQMDARFGRPVAYAAPPMAYPAPPFPYPATQGAYPAPPMAVAPWTPMPAWANPFAQMTRPWQYPAPRYSRQFASRPAERRRPSAPGDYRPVAARAGAARAMARPAPTFAAAPAWRPSAAPAVAHTAFVSRRGVGYRPIAARPAIEPRIAMAGMPRNAWRPASRHHPSAAAGGEFRPAGYGRGATLAQRAARSGVDRLPGWATTYDSPLGAPTCDWCGGS